MCYMLFLLLLLFPVASKMGQKKTRQLETLTGSDPTKSGASKAILGGIYAKLLWFLVLNTTAE